MNFDSPYSIYVITAYIISSALISAVAIRSWKHWLQAKKAWLQAADHESEGL